MNDIDGFIGAHDDRLPPEVIEEARAAAHEAGLPFSEKPYRDGEDFNPYVFDGSMSIEDFELMHRMIEKERSEQMVAPDKKTLKKSVKSMFFMVQTRCEVETIKY
jgi:hypothetical protein